jgi:hypothetical protein
MINLKKMKRLCVIIGVISYMLVTQISYAAPGNLNYYLEFRGIVKEPAYYEKLPENLIDSSLISVADETGAVVETTYSDKHGKWKIKLPLNKEYLIKISKKGFVEKSIHVNSNVPDFRLESYTVLCDVYLYKQIDGLDVSILRAPVANMIFNNTRRTFTYDHRYTDAVNDKITRMYLDYFSRSQEGGNEAEMAPVK